MGKRKPLYGSGCPALQPQKNAQAGPAARSFRLVCQPAQIASVEEMLREEGHAFEPEPFSPFCRRLTYEPAPLGRSLAAFFGYIYIQDRSSMLPPLALAPDSGDRVLDMCASPGSKSGFLAQLVGRNGFVLANEPARQRLATLRANLGRMNLLQCATSSVPGERLPLQDGSFDRILLDAPCSGWGTAQKHPEVLKLWRQEKTGGLIRLQRQLLASAGRLLAPGGRLVYSTCTTNAAENEDQIRYAADYLGLVPQKLDPFTGFFHESADGAPWLRVDGERSGAQGFFLALLGKPDDPGFQAPACPPYASAWREIAPDALAGATLDPALLPAGCIALFGDKARFLPKKAHLPHSFPWQGHLLGRLAGGRLVAEPRLRVLCPAPGPERAIILEKLDDIGRLLSGQSLDTGLPGRDAALWWKDLPLGRVQLRNGQALARFGHTP